MVTIDLVNHDGELLWRRWIPEEALPHAIVDSGQRFTRVTDVVQGGVIYRLTAEMSSSAQEPFRSTGGDDMFNATE